MARLPLAEPNPVTTSNAGPRLVERHAEHPGVCRCGTRIAPPAACYGVEGLPAPVQELFREQSFCSAPCIRAAFLEKLSLLEVLDTPPAEQLVTDLRQTYLLLATAFSQVLAGSSGHWFLGSPGR